MQTIVPIPKFFKISSVFLNLLETPLTVRASTATDFLEVRLRIVIVLSRGVPCKGGAWWKFPQAS